MSLNPQDVLLSGEVAGSGNADLSDESPMEFLYKWSNAGKSLAGSALEGADALYKNELYYYNCASAILQKPDNAKLTIAFGGFSVKAIKALAVQLKALHEKRILEEQMEAAVTQVADSTNKYGAITAGKAAGIFSK